MTLAEACLRRTPIATLSGKFVQGAEHAEASSDPSLLVEEIVRPGLVCPLSRRSGAGAIHRPRAGLWRIPKRHRGGARPSADRPLGGARPFPRPHSIFPSRDRLGRTVIPGGRSDIGVRRPKGRPAKHNLLDSTGDLAQNPARHVRCPAVCWQMKATIARQVKARNEMQGHTITATANILQFRPYRHNQTRKSRTRSRKNGNFPDSTGNGPCLRLRRPDWNPRNINGSFGDCCGTVRSSHRGFSYDWME